MTKPASPVSATARYRVDRTAKEDRLSGGWHNHIRALCLADGRLVPKAEAIANVRTGAAVYYLLDDGALAEVTIGERCPRCAEPYLRASNDSSVHEALIRLPNC